MVTFTHSMLAGRAYKHFTDENYKLSKFWLKLGSIKPDFVKDEINHIKDESIYLLYQKYKKLKNINPSKKNKLFSLRLGEIYHYICDFFCSAHNEKRLCKDPVRHTIYEFKLNHFAQKLDDDHYNIHSLEEIAYDMTFPQLIEYYHRKYLKKTPSFSNDILTSYKLCILVTLKLMIEIGYYSKHIDSTHRKMKTI